MFGVVLNVLKVNQDSRTMSTDSLTQSVHGLSVLLFLTWNVQTKLYRTQTGNAILKLNL